MYYGKFKKESKKNKNKLRTVYTKNHENFKSSKPKVQFYGFLHEKECNTLSEAVLLDKSLKSSNPCHVENKLYLVHVDKYTLNLLFL